MEKLFIYLTSFKLLGNNIILLLELVEKFPYQTWAGENSQEKSLCHIIGPNKNINLSRWKYTIKPLDGWSDGMHANHLVSGCHMFSMQIRRKKEEYSSIGHTGCTDSELGMVWLFLKMTQLYC